MFTAGQIVILRVQIVTYSSIGTPPGVVVCTVDDAHGKTWRLHVRVDNVSRAFFEPNSPWHNGGVEAAQYPQPGEICCLVLSQRVDHGGCPVVRVELDGLYILDPVHHAADEQTDILEVRPEQLITVIRRSS